MADNAPVPFKDARVSVFGLNSTGPIEALAVVQLDSTGGIGGGAGSTLQTVRQSTGSDLQVLLTGLQGSSVSSNSSVYLPVRLTNGTSFLASGSDYLHNSTADFTVSTVAGPMSFLRSGAAAEGSTDHTIAQWGSSDGAAYVAMVDSTGSVLSASTATPVNNVVALNVRSVPSSMQSTTVEVQSSNSTVLMALLSSGAVTKRVHAFFVGASTSGNPSTFIFLSSGTQGDAGVAKNRWALSLSSGYSAGHLAVDPPSYLFAGDVNEALNCRIESLSTRIIARVSLSWVDA